MRPIEAEGLEPRPPRSSEWRRLFAGREAEFERLLAAWRRVTDTDDPRSEVVVIAGQPGAGKTRLAQEFYRWLAAEENGLNNGYWVAELADTEKSLNLHPTFPADHTVTVGERLPYLWYAIRYDNPQNQGTQPGPLESARLHIEPHLRYQRYLRELKRTGIDFVKEDVLGLVWSIGSGLFQELPGVGLASKGKEIFDQVSSLAEKIKSVREGRAQARETLRDLKTVQERSYAETLRDELLQLVGSGEGPCTPIVFVIDDAQWVGAKDAATSEARHSEALRFLDRMIKLALERRLPILFIATHWVVEWKQDLCQPPEPSDSPDASSSAGLLPPTLVELLAGLEGTAWPGHVNEVRARYEAGLEPFEVEDAPEGLIWLDDIPHDACSAIVAHADALPGVAAKTDQLDRVLDTAGGNPRMLGELILHLQADDENFEDRDPSGPLSPAGLDRLSRIVPGELYHVVQRRFAELPQPLKQILKYCAVQGSDFHENVTKALATELAARLMPSDDVRDAWFRAAENPLTFITNESRAATIYEFDHPIHYQVSRAALEVEHDAVTRCLHGILKNWIAGTEMQAWPAEERTFVWRLAAHVLADSSDPDDQAPAARANAELVERYVQIGQLGDARTHALALCSLGGEVVAPLISADGLWAISDALTAFNLLEPLVTFLRDTLEVDLTPSAKEEWRAPAPGDHELQSDARRLLLVPLLNLGRLDEARELAETARRRAERRDMESPTTQTRCALANASSDMGRVESALGRLTEAQRLFEVALEILQGLDAADPGTYDGSLVVVHGQLGTVALTYGHVKSARRHHEAALAYTRSHDRQTSTRASRRSLLYALCSVADVAIHEIGPATEEKRLDEARDHYGRALVIAEELDAGERTSETREDRAFVHGRLINVALKEGQDDEAVRHAEQRATLSWEVNAERATVETRSALTHALTELGDLFIDIERVSAAAKPYRLLEPTVAELSSEPLSTATRNDLVRSLGALGQASIIEGKEAEARRHFRQVFSIGHASYDDDRSLDLLRLARDALDRAGDLAEADGNEELEAWLWERQDPVEDALGELLEEVETPEGELQQEADDYRNRIVGQELAARMGIDRGKDEWVLRSVRSIVFWATLDEDGEESKEIVQAAVDALVRLGGYAGDHDATRFLAPIVDARDQLLAALAEL